MKVNLWLRDKRTRKLTGEIGTQKFYSNGRVISQSWWFFYVAVGILF
jgi:hypothetical protein